MKQSFEIPGRLPGLKEYTSENRTQPMRAAKQKHNTEDMIKWCAKAAHIKPMRSPIHVHIKWIEPNMRRDKDNIRFAVKYILDALVSLGTIKDDGWKQIGGRRHPGITDEYMVNKSNPRVVVELEEL